MQLYGSRLRAAVCWNKRCDCELQPIIAAAFGRLCVETDQANNIFNGLEQPPSGGCVLKPLEWRPLYNSRCSRLRAAVCWNRSTNSIMLPFYAAAFGRLCVETYLLHHTLHKINPQPPSGGCVLKQHGISYHQMLKLRSRLRAAVCWNLSFLHLVFLFYAAAFGRLCVETL